MVCWIGAWLSCHRAFHFSSNFVNIRDPSSVRCLHCNAQNAYVKYENDFPAQIHPGMVIRTMFWADSARGGKPSDKGKGIQCTAECDVIKAFTLMEIELVCKVCSDPGCTFGVRT